MIKNKKNKRDLNLQQQQYDRRRMNQLPTPRDDDPSYAEFIDDLLRQRFARELRNDNSTK